MWGCGGGFVTYIAHTNYTKWSRILLGALVLSLLRASFPLRMLILFRFLATLLIALPLFSKFMALIVMFYFTTILIPSHSFATNSKAVTNVTILSKPALSFLFPFATFKLLILIFFFFLGVLTQKLKGFFIFVL